MFAAALIVSCVIQTQPERGWSFDHPVEAGAGDVSPLYETLRVMPLDMRAPDNWERVYRMDSAFGPVYARRSGALTAVFPQADYALTRSGMVATIPADTTFVIGEPAPWLLRQLGLDSEVESLSHALSGRLNTSIDLSIDPQLLRPTLATRSAAEPESPRTTASDRLREIAAFQIEREVSPWFNDRVRRHRVSMLLDRALRASDGR